MILLILYFVVKYAAYVAWCLFGLDKFRPDSEDQQSRAFLYGFLRLLIGFVFGVLVFVVLIVLAPGSGTRAMGSYLAYFAIYLPVRWVEWTIMAILIIPGSNPFLRWLSGLNRPDRLWRLGGIGISFLADVPVLIAIGGFPIGRILC